MPVDPELADLRGFLAGEGIAELPERLALTFRPRGTRLGAGDDVVLVRSGAVNDDGVVTADALLLVRPSAVTPTGVRLLALDVETTGLVPGRDRVVSVGWVPVDGDRLDLAGARRFVVRGDDPGAAADIHGLTHDDLAAGTPLPQVLAELRRALQGRALLAHHATFDLGFLQAAFRDVGERMPRVPVVCTLILHKRLLRADRLEEWPAGALRLWTAREPVRPARRASPRRARRRRGLRRALRGAGRRARPRPHTHPARAPDADRMACPGRSPLAPLALAGTTPVAADARGQRLVAMRVEASEATMTSTVVKRSSVSHSSRSVSTRP